MTLIQDLLIKDLDDLVNITDAEYPGDPNGTDANEAYFAANVHPYIQTVTKALIENNSYMVNPRIAALADVGSPFFGTIQAAHAAISGSGANNKYVIYVGASATDYSEALSLNQSSCHITIVGLNKYANKISGTTNITAGIYILRNLHFVNNITQSGGVSNIENCAQTTGSTVISGNSTAMINNCGTWGGITVSGDTNIVWLENIKGVGGDVTLTPGMTGGTYVVKDVGMTGSFIDTTSLVTLFGNLYPGQPARPNF